MKEKLAILCEWDRPEDIFNMDKTGLYFRVTENKILFRKGQDCGDGKKSKLHLTISLCSSMTGEKVKMLIIWKYANPLCFKTIKKKNLPVDYFANKNAWITSGVFETWLKALDWKMRFSKILLFLDNPLSHADINFSLPTQHQSYSQWNGSGYYSSNKNKVQKDATAKFDYEAWKRKGKVLQWVDALQAIYWVKNIWEAVLPLTIIKCFVKCGFKTSWESIHYICILVSVYVRQFFPFYACNCTRTRQHTCH